MNYFSLIEDIKNTSLQFVEEFYEGDVYEFLNSGNHKYPSVILTTQNVATDDGINTIGATLFCVDRLTDDSANKLEVQSDMFDRLQRIISTLEENTTNLESNTYTPFTEKFADLCAGMFVEFSLQYVGDTLCDNLIEIKEIELTKNGIYDVIGYDKAVVNVKPKLQDITITENGEYTPQDGVDGFGKVVTNVVPKEKVKVKGFAVNNTCINEDGIWEGEQLIDTSEVISFQSIFENNTKIAQLDASNWNTSKVTGVRWMFRGASNIHTINVSGWDMTNVNNNVAGFQEMFNMTTKLKKIIGISNWKPNVNVATYYRMFTGSGIEELDLSGYTGVVGNADAMFYQCGSLHTLNVSDLDVSQCGTFNYCFGLDTKLKELDLTKWNMSSATSTNNMFWRNTSLKSIVGGRNIDDVIVNNIGVMNGIKTLSSNTFTETNGLDRASLRAIINGLADLSDTTAKTLTLGATLLSKLTEEDITIATNKNWTIA